MAIYTSRNWCPVPSRMTALHPPEGAWLLSSLQIEEEMWVKIRVIYLCLYDPLYYMDIVCVFIVNSCNWVKCLRKCADQTLYTLIHCGFWVRMYVPMPYSPCVFTEGPRHTHFSRVLSWHWRFQCWLKCRLTPLSTSHWLHSEKRQMCYFSSVREWERCCTPINIWWNHLSVPHNAPWYLVHEYCDFLTRLWIHLCVNCSWEHLCKKCHIR